MRGGFRELPDLILVRLAGGTGDGHVSAACGLWRRPAQQSKRHSRPAVREGSQPADTAEAVSAGTGTTGRRGGNSGNFHHAIRTNVTDAATRDPESRYDRRTVGQSGRPSSMGPAVPENRYRPAGTGVSSEASRAVELRDSGDMLTVGHRRVRHHPDVGDDKPRAISPATPPPYPPAASSVARNSEQRPDQGLQELGKCRRRLPRRAAGLSLFAIAPHHNPSQVPLGNAARHDPEGQAPRACSFHRGLHFQAACLQLGPTTEVACRIRGVCTQ